jgi:hypothetical protein
MRKMIILFLTISSGLAAQTKSILWLGNSYTAVNNLPDLVYQLALSGGDTLQYDSNTPGGYTLQLHTQDATSLAKINQQSWDYVVLQAQSQEPSLDTPYVVTNVFPNARKLDSLIHVNDSCTQTVFYMTWGRKNGDASNCAAYPPVCTYQGMQDQLRNRYLQMAYDNNAMVAPCGEAWRDAIATTPAFDLYMSDQSHPSAYGSYLNACVFYASIYRRSPVGFTYYGGLPANDALFLQQVAAATVLDSMLTWNTEVYYDDPSFTAAVISGTTFSFSATTTGANHEWNFGQGFQAGTANETYTFPSNGVYVVGHVTNNGCLTDTAWQTVISGPAGLPSPEQTGINIGFDEGFNLVNISTGTITSSQVKIIDAAGRVVIQQNVQGNTQQIMCDQLSNGMYSVEVIAGGNRAIKKIVVLH